MAQGTIGDNRKGKRPAAGPDEPPPLAWQAGSHPLKEEPECDHQLSTPPLCFSVHKKEGPRSPGSEPGQWAISWFVGRGPWRVSVAGKLAPGCAWIFLVQFRLQPPVRRATPPLDMLWANRGLSLGQSLSAEATWWSNTRAADR